MNKFLMRMTTIMMIVIGVFIVASAKEYPREFKKVCNELEKRQTQIQKDEFETTDQWTSRIASFDTKPFMDSIMISDTLIATYKSDGFNMMLSSYNADDSIAVFDIGIKPVKREFDTDYDLDGLWLAEEIVDTTSYIATNGFGSKVLVTKRWYTEYAMVFPKESLGEFRGTLKPEVAKAYRNNPKRIGLRLIYVINGKPFRGTMLNEATYDDPQDIWFEMHNIPTTIIDSYLFDISTNKKIK
jgi:hypothetical protein